MQCSKFSVLTSLSVMAKMIRDYLFLLLFLKIKYLLENTLRRRHNTCLKMNLVIYVITSLYTQWNISYQSGSVQTTMIYFRIYIYRYIYFQWNSFSAIENYFLKKTRSKSIRIYLIFIFNKFFLFNWKLLLKNMFEKYLL